MASCRGCLNNNCAPLVFRLPANFCKWPPKAPQSPSWVPARNQDPIARNGSQIENGQATLEPPALSGPRPPNALCWTQFREKGKIFREKNCKRFLCFFVRQKININFKL